MKRLVAFASLVTLATTAVCAAPVAPKHVAAKPAACKVAPADEYFGRLKMSILGIRNTIKDQGLRIDADASSAPKTLNAIALTEDAIHDWEHKYPCDSWLAPTIFALEHFYAKIHTDDGLRHVHAAFAWLRHDFPRHALVATAAKEDREAAIPPAAPIAEAPPAPAPSP